MNAIDRPFPKGSEEASSAKDDVWIPSSCAFCYGSCSIKVHRVDGVIVKIEGNPESAIGKGRMCAKGVSGLMIHYDPNRLTKPLRRTNPKKGIGIDPGWKEISWEEAMDEIVGHLKRIRAEDPRKLVIQRTTTVTANKIPFQAFAFGFGTPNHSVSGGGLALRQRRPSDQRHHACLVGHRAGLPVTATTPCISAPRRAIRPATPRPRTWRSPPTPGRAA